MAQFSLLWPAGEPTDTWAMPAETIRDLELPALVNALCPHEPYREVVAPIVYQLCLDPDTIRYRQDVIADLQAQPPLAEALRDLLPVLDELALFSYRHADAGTSLHEVVARAGELELLVEAVHRLQEAFAAVTTPLQSTALIKLRDYIETVLVNTEFQQLVDNLPPLLSKLRTSASITIGVNLDPQLRPEEAILLAVNDYRFDESTLLDRLLGKGTGDGKGIAPLHTPPMISRSSGMITGAMPMPGPAKRADPMLEPLFRDLSDVLEKVTQPIAHELKKYVQLNGRFLVSMRPDIIFFVHALALIERLAEAGMPWRRPEIAPTAARVCQVSGAYNVQLALQRLHEGDDGALPERIVANDIKLGEDGRIAILTGPNQGGKTTYMQSVGQVQVLAQLGLPIPATAGRISPVDAIYTHYPTEERLERGTGRFGDEAQRIRAIFEKVTPTTLLLLNESLASTHPGESLYLARDIVSVLRQIGLRALFTTHLHDLAAAAEEINAATPGDSDVFSLVASPIEPPLETKPHYSYRVQRMPPVGRSYAENIAARYGLSSDQLHELLAERNLLPDQN